MIAAETTNITGIVARQLENDSRVIDLTAEPPAKLFLDCLSDLSKRVLVFNSNQTVEFGRALNLEGSVVFLNGATLGRSLCEDNFKLIKGKVPLPLVSLSPDGEIDFKDTVPETIVGKFKSMHKELFAVKHEVQLSRIDPFCCSAPALERFFAECWFLALHPSLPLENIGSSLENYHPKNDSQQKAKAAAEKLLGLQDPSKPAGLFLEGTPGVGKTHLSVALALEFMCRGWPTYFLSGSKSDIPEGAFRSRQPAAWILDDLNSPYGVGMENFRRLIVHVHETGGRLFVTSNTGLDNLMEHGFVTAREEKPRIMDRFKGMMLALNVIGDSNRVVSPWFKE